MITPHGEYDSSALRALVPQSLQTIIVPHLCSELSSDEDAESVRAFGMAIEAIKAAVGIWRQVHIYFGTSPLVRRASIAKATIEISADCVAISLDDAIYIDLSRLARCPFEVRVAAFIEEFCHVLLNIKSEPLVQTVVCKLYPSVRRHPSLDRYIPAAESEHNH